METVSVTVKCRTYYLDIESIRDSIGTLLIISDSVCSLLICGIIGTVYRTVCDVCERSACALWLCRAADGGACGSPRNP